jgi:hypothetical protein
MKSTNFNIVRYDADDGMVFDWKEPRYIEVFADGVSQGEVQEHLYVKTLFIGPTDSIDNYIEVEEVIADAGNENS